MREQVDQIAERLRAVTRDGGIVEAAQVRVIGLDEVRVAAGIRWERMRERVRNGSMAIMARLLGPNDVILPAGDGFLVIFADSDAAHSTALCLQIREALLSFYLGEEALSALALDVTRTPIAAEALKAVLAEAKRERHVQVVAKAAQGEVGFAPIYVPQEGHVGAVLASPIIQDDAHPRRIGYNPQFSAQGVHLLSKDYLELDLAVLDNAINVARQFSGARRHAIGVTVHSSTMRQRRAREAYLGWLRDIDPAIRRWLFVMIAEIDRGTPMISITDWCSGLRHHVARVWLEFHVSDRALNGLAGAGVWAAGFHLPIAPGAGHGSRAAYWRDQVDHWAKALTPQGVRLMVHGVEDTSFLHTAEEAGAHFLLSDKQWPIVADPAATMPAPAAAAR